jgi:dTDP-4-dehydrorhamnose 3,5-epimerase
MAVICPTWHGTAADMEVVATAIADVKLIRPAVYGDARGFLLETWNRRAFAAAGLDATFVQDNHSRSARGTLRGLHYQVRQTQGKLVRVGAGTIFDVCVDVRRSSPSFGQWVGMMLSDENHESVWVPPGFAHGFLVLSETADVHYKLTDFHAPEQERSIRWDDANLAIDWPLPAGLEPQLSPRDRDASRFADAEYLP